MICVNGKYKRLKSFQKLMKEERSRDIKEVVWFQNLHFSWWRTIFGKVWTWSRKVQMYYIGSKLLTRKRNRVRPTALAVSVHSLYFVSQCDWYIFSQSATSVTIVPSFGCNGKFEKKHRIEIRPVWPSIEWLTMPLTSVQKINYFYQCIVFRLVCI